MPTTATTYSATAGWAEQEVGDARFGDKRLSKRLGLMLTRMSQQSQSSLPQTFASWAGTKACYNFLNNDAVSVGAIIAPHAEATRQRCESEPLVLAIQDTTEVNLTQLKATAGLGKLHLGSRGILVHSCIAVSPDGRALGVLHQHQWVRSDDEPIAATRRQRPTADKESQRWIDTLSAVESRLSTPVVVVADAEADIFDLFAHQRSAHVDLLIRVAHNRTITGEHRLLNDALANAPVLGGMIVEIDRTPERAARTARCIVSCMSVELKPPHRRRGPGVRVQVIRVKEVDPIGEPINWILATTLPINSFADAVGIVGYYVQRWIIERFHYVLKSGCGIEELQLQTASALHNAIAIYSIVAWRLLWLLYTARLDADQPCTTVLTTDQTTVLTAVRTKKTGKSTTHVPSIGEAVAWIAQLGGYLARASDGPPGVKTLWVGLRRLDALVDGWLLAQSLLKPS